MWKPVTRAQSMPGRVASSARNASCESPDANMTFAAPRLAMQSRIVAAAASAA